MQWPEQVRVLRRRFRLTDEEIIAGGEFALFCDRLLGIKVHVGQIAFAAKVLLRHKMDPSSAAYLTLMLSSGNRAGKTSLLAMVIIYACIKKLNRPLPPEKTETEEERLRYNRWMRMEYHWYHFGIAQEVADLVYNDMVRILSGTHEGQADGCPLSKGPTVATWEQKEYGDYRWIRFTAQFGGAEVHFRTTGEKALGSLGKDMHGVSFDEAGIERNLDFLIKEVFNLRRLGTGGQLIMVSTPSEDLGYAFADNWEKGNPLKRDRLVGWMSMRMSTRDNVGYGITKSMFDRLIADMDERTIRQNIDGEFLQSKGAYFNGENVELCFVSGLPERLQAVKNGIYLQGIDPASGNAKNPDSAWGIVLNVVENPDDPERPYLVGVSADQKSGQKSTEAVIAIAFNGFVAYENKALGSHCYTATDATGFGGKLFREALDKEVPNVTNVEFGGTIQKKRKLLGDLRTLIDEGRLILPRTGIWLRVRRQLLGYKLEDRGIEQDAVMALVCAVFLLRRAPVHEADIQAFDINGSNAWGLTHRGDDQFGAAAIARERIKARGGR